MRRLLEADYNRLVVKIVPWLLLGLVYVVMAVTLSVEIDTSLDRDYFFIQTVAECYANISTIIGFTVLFGVYGDEFKSMAMIGVIGRGITREKFVFTKFLDGCLLSLLMVCISAVYILILEAVFGVKLSGLHTKFFICMFIFYYITEIAYVTIASIFYFMSENAAVGLVAYFIFELVVPVTLELMAMFSDKFKSLHVQRYYITGMGASAYSDFILGDPLNALLTIVPGVAIYIGGSLLITMLIFRHKELEF